MREIEIDWLGACPACSNDLSIVNTEAEGGEYLDLDDDVRCSGCGHKGVIDIDESYDPPVAYASWDDVVEGNIE